jgi:hypothetical protein
MNVIYLVIQIKNKLVIDLEIEEGSTYQWQNNVAELRHHELQVAS